MPDNETIIKNLGELKTHLNNFSKSADAITAIWLQHHSTLGLDASIFLDRQYPFHQSFDELAIAITEWKDDAIGRIAVFEHQLKNKNPA